MLYGFKVFYPIFDVKLRTIMEVLRLPQGEQFVAGSGNLKRVYQRLVKIYDPLLFFCRKGEGRVSIDLKEYEVIENTLIFLMPGSIVSCSYRSEDLEFSFAICFRKLHSVSNMPSSSILRIILVCSSLKMIFQDFMDSFGPLTVYMTIRSMFSGFRYLRISCNVS